MVLKRVIPCLDVDSGRVVKGTNFVGLRDAGDPVELAERYDAEGADELVFLDITASHERRETIVELARRTADNVFIPFTIGGGIRSVEDAGAALRAGADKVAVNTAAVKDPALVTRLSEAFGTQCVVAAVDVVVTKPGYGIISECVANDTALLYTDRGHFIEYDVLVAEMPRYLRCAYLPQAALLTGHWQDALDALASAPPAPPAPRVDGAAVAADWIRQQLG